MYLEVRLPEAPAHLPGVIDLLPPPESSSKFHHHPSEEAALVPLGFEARASFGFVVLAPLIFCSRLESVHANFLDTPTTLLSHERPNHFYILSPHQIPRLL